MRVSKESIDRFYDYDIHPETRTLYMGSVSVQEDGESGTDAHMAERCIKGLHILEASAPNGDKPITIIMNNPGGDVYHGLAIFDAIKTCKNHVTIIVYGYAMSMGSIILQAADRRVMGSNARVMLHYGTDGFSGHVKTLEKVAEESKKLSTWDEKLFLDKIKQKRSDYTIAKVRKLLEHDTFLTAQEALDLGLIDEIIGE
jgi:ATP-dependent Clp endopeptidase proteolytic subunit ClpP